MQHRAKGLLDRFWSKVDILGPDDCWEWKAFRDRDGYGKFNVYGTMEVASRVAFEIHNKERLGDRFACHKCDNPSCCNPAHIYAGDPQTNMDDASERDRFNRPPPEAHPSTKLDWDKVAEIKRRIQAGESNYRIRFSYGVSAATIKKIRDGATWNKP